ncbi:GNAT family N-acetyltransferase [uncultured Paraglaciecola sp.]|uniref:GNAT family N-acetyltransferase n=1 Tax=uncultured Paraglaciecola sp. TaxID=1765024 RepID=UPI0030D99F4B|tara:strand:+ start:18955 stop:19437 length:483 start_codon:yes stop_codon:yes gene_type:complete
MKIDVFILNYQDTQHAQDMLFLLENYALDPMGGANALIQTVKENLAIELSKLPHAFSVICYVDGQPAGLANCFEAFSTFKCQPLINIHDLVVLSEFRGLGVSQKILQHIEHIAEQKGCCKVTLEVLEGNHIAKNAYLKFGFSGYELDPQMGKALFWEKPL